MRETVSSLARMKRSSNVDFTKWFWTLLGKLLSVTLAFIVENQDDCVAFSEAIYILYRFCSVFAHAEFDDEIIQVVFLG